MLPKAREIITKEYKALKLREIFKHYENMMGVFHKPY